MRGPIITGPIVDATPWPEPAVFHRRADAGLRGARRALAGARAAMEREVAATIDDEARIVVKGGARGAQCAWTSNAWTRIDSRAMTISPDRVARRSACDLRDS